MTMNTQLVWQRLARPELGVLDSISECVAREELLSADRFTSVRRGPTLLVASDCGGAHKGSAFETVSFLVIDLQYAWLWEELRTQLRKRFLRDGRRMSFKALNDSRRRRALIPFLRAANTLPGLLATFALDRRASFLLSEDPPTRPESAVGALGSWSIASFQKLTRVAHLAALLVAGLSAPGQNIVWISDEDDLAPNVEKIREATRIFGHYLNHCLAHDVGHIRFGTTSFTDAGGRDVEDLAALPDLAAGALAEMFTGVHRSSGIPSVGGLVVPTAAGTSPKARILAHWLAENDHPLRKLLTVITAESNHTLVRIVDLFPEGSGPDYDWSPDVQSLLADRLIAWV